MKCYMLGGPLDGQVLETTGRHETLYIAAGPIHETTEKVQYVLARVVSTTSGKEALFYHTGAFNLVRDLTESRVKEIIDKVGHFGEGR